MATIYPIDRNLLSQVLGIDKRTLRRFMVNRKAELMEKFPGFDIDEKYFPPVVAYFICYLHSKISVNTVFSRIIRTYYPSETPDNKTLKNCYAVDECHFIEMQWFPYNNIIANEKLGHSTSTPDISGQ